MSATLQVAFGTTPLGGPLPLPEVRPPRELRGPHTAGVVGPPGQRVYVDQFSRVQVRFARQRDVDAAVWGRVNQAWAGDGRGALAIPHVGDEVLVEFAHGDACRPIVVGTLYNGDAMPPAALPEQAA